MSVNCKITGKLFSIINRLQEEQKKPKDYGVGKTLYNSEIKFINYVYRYPKVKASELSAQLSITKSAVTQIADRLVERGLIEMFQIDGNKKEKFFRLTPLGEKARKRREEIYAQRNAELCAYYCTLTETEKAVIIDFLDHLEKSVPFCEFSCSGNECYVEELGKDEYNE